MAGDISVLQFLSSPGPPLYALLLLLGFWSYRVSVLGLPAIIERFNDRRRARAEEKAGDWSRLREERDRATESRDTWMQRAIAAEAEKARLEAIDLGEGQVRQAQAEVAAYERLVAENERLRKLAGEKAKPDG